MARIPVTHQIADIKHKPGLAFADFVHNSFDRLIARTGIAHGGKIKMSGIGSKHLPGRSHKTFMPRIVERFHDKTAHRHHDQSAEN